MKNLKNLISMKVIIIEIKILSIKNALNNNNKILKKKYIRNYSQSLESNSIRISII